MRRIPLELVGVGTWQDLKMQRYIKDQEDNLLVFVRLLRLSEKMQGVSIHQAKAFMLSLDAQDESAKQAPFDVTVKM